MQGDDKKKLGFVQVLSSVVSSFIGVQSDAKRQRDFSQGRPRDFILVGLLLTLVFILTVWGIVSLVMYLAIP